MRGTFHDDGPFASVLAKAQHPSSPYHAMYPVGRYKDSTNRRCMHAFQTQGLSQKLGPGRQWNTWNQIIKYFLRLDSMINRNTSSHVVMY